MAICGRDRARLASAEAGLNDQGGDILALPADVADIAPVAAAFHGTLLRRFPHRNFDRYRLFYEVQRATLAGC